MASFFLCYPPPSLLLPRIEKATISGSDDQAFLALLCGRDTPRRRLPFALPLCPLINMSIASAIWTPPSFKRPPLETPLIRKQASPPLSFKPPHTVTGTTPIPHFVRDLRFAQCRGTLLLPLLFFPPPFSPLNISPPSRSHFPRQHLLVSIGSILGRDELC